MNLVGIDIGGTKICVCLGDEKGNILASKRIATQPLKNWQNGLKAAAELVREFKDIDAIGISAPGPISLKQGKMLRPPNLPGWENAELVKFFKETFHKPVAMNHDGKAAVLAEYQFGASKGVQNMVYLTCSTGMGGGAIVNGQLVQGASDTAAEVGHFILDVNGDACPCGLKGCFETFCGGAALAKKAGRSVEALVDAVRKKEPEALRIWDEFIMRLAQGIGTVLMNFNPEVVILGTIAIHSGSLLLDPLKKQLPHFAWKENIHACRIEASALGDKISELSGIALAKACQKITFIDS